MRGLLAVLVLVAVPARAQDAPTTPAPPVPVAANPDAELLSALVVLFDPFVSPAARLHGFDAPALRDPRAIPPLVFLLSDRDPTVRVSAVRALAAFSDPRVERALIDRVSMRSELENVRIAAADALARVGGPDAGTALYAVFVDEDEPLPIRTAARRALEARFPQLLRDRRITEVQDRSGRQLLTVGSAVLGSYALASVGALGQNASGTTIGALGGLVVGGGSSYLLTRTGEITVPQAGWILSGGTWGASLGMLASAAIEDRPSTRFTLSLGLAGEAIGVASTIYTRSRMHDGQEVALIDIGGLLGADLAEGAYLLQDANHTQILAGAVLGSSALGLAAGGLVAPALDLKSPGDRTLIAETTYEGLAFGLLTPLAVGSSNDHRTEAGGFLGAGLGMIAGTALSQVTNASRREVGVAWLIGSYGKVLGLSIPMLGDGNDASLARGTIAGSAIALGAGAALAPELRFHDGDIALIGIGTGLGLWHGIAFGASSVKLDDTQTTGLALLGLSAGGLGAIALSQTVSPTPTEALVLGGGAFWGNWFTLWGSELARHPGDTLDLRPAVVVGDVGVAASALLLSRVDARRIGVANLGGLAGAGLASLGAALATKDNNTVIAANLAGSGLGLVAGGVLAASLHLSPPAPPSSVSNGPPLVGPVIGPLVVSPSAGTAVGMSVTFFD